MRVRFTLAWSFLIIVTPVAIAGEPRSPKEIIATLPEISSETQCQRDEWICDYTVQNHVFDTLGQLAKKHLRKGMSKTEVRALFGEPPGWEANRREPWKDLRYGHTVEMWDYAITLSGTTIFALVFVNDCLDYYETGQLGLLPAYYGRPGTNPDALRPDEPYRVSKDAPACQGK